MKNTCFKFVINVSRQGNNVKMKLNLKVNLQRLQPQFFCEINGNTTGFCLGVSWHIHNRVKQIIKRVLQKYSTVKCSQIFLQKAPTQMFHWVMNMSMIIVSEWVSEYVSAFSEEVFKRCFLQMFLKKIFRKNLQHSHLCWSLFIIKLPVCEPANSLKRDTNAGFIL